MHDDVEDDGVSILEVCIVNAFIFSFEDRKGLVVNPIQLTSPFLIIMND